MGHTLVATGELNKARAHYDAGIALYNPHEHRPLATRFGQDFRVTILSWRSLALWLLGYPEAALRDADDAVKYGREIGQAASVMFALFITAIVHILSGNYSLSDRTGPRTCGSWSREGRLTVEGGRNDVRRLRIGATGKAAQAVEMLTTGNIAYRSTGSTVILSWMLSHLAKSYSELGKFDDAKLCIREVMTTIETTNERWFQGEAHRIAGEIVLNSNEADVRKAETYFEEALTVARAQQAKSWELRAAMSMARLWRDQGKRDAARELLAPVYGWFTEGFDTLDLKEAKAMLDELAV